MLLALDTIRIAYSSVNPHALLVSMAEKRGLYAKYGLSSTIVYVSGGSTVIQAMVSGDIDLGQLTGAPGVTANLRGADIVYIAMSDDRIGYQLVTRCTSTVIGGVNYFQCGGVYYRAGFQGNSVVYIVSQP